MIVVLGTILAGWQLTRPRFGNISQELASLVNTTAGRDQPIKNAVLYVSKGDGYFTWSGASGIASQDGQVPMMTNTPFYIASTTKLFTATAIMVLSSTFYWADGGIVSTPEDLILFMKALQQGRLVRADTLEKTRQWKPLSNPGMPFQYGYGTMEFVVPSFINRVAKVPPTWGHTGSIGSFLYYVPDLDLYMAGTIDQENDKITPIMLMIKVMKAFQQYK